MKRLLLNVLLLLIAPIGLLAQCQPAFVVYDIGGYMISFIDTTPNITGNETAVWDFGDGTTQNVGNPNSGPLHTYQNQGIYTVCLNYYTNGNLCGTMCDTIWVGTDVCHASYTSRFTLSGNPYLVEFVPVTTKPNLTYNWDFGDGQTNTTLSTTTTHYYAASGTYTACLTISDTSGCMHTYCNDVIVSNTSTSCQAYFGSMVDLYYGGNNFIIDSSIVNGPYMAYLYINNVLVDSSDQFGFPVYFPSPGQHSLCMEIVSANCSSTYCDTVNVIGNGNYQISGSVFAQLPPNTGDTAMVYLIQADSTNLYLIDSMIAQSNDFNFTGLTEGHYLVKAALTPNSSSYSNYLPTYAGGVQFWQQADVIGLEASNPTLSEIIMLTNTSQNPGGPGFVGGLISQGANKQGEGDPEVGVQVMLLDMNDNPVQYTYSNAQGEWEFSNIAYGTYQVYAEVAGKTTEPVTLTLSAANETFDNVSLTVETQRITGTAITSGIEEILMSTSNLYPNPTTGGATMTITTDRSANAELVVINAMGQEVMREELMLNVGQQDLNFNISSSPMGIYFMQLRIEGTPVINERILKQ